MSEKLTKLEIAIAIRDNGYKYKCLHPSYEYECRNCELMDICTRCLGFGGIIKFDEEAVDAYILNNKER